MAEPTKKATEIEQLIDSINPSGRKRVDSIESNLCSWCGEHAAEFRDNLSRREYTISGFCQQCQDKTFGESEPDEPLEVITLQRPDWGYCVTKCLRDLNNPKYAHLPDFCTAEEHGKDSPIILRTGTGKEICQLDYETFHRVYVID